MLSTFSAWSARGRLAARLAVVTVVSGLAAAGALVTAGPAGAVEGPQSPGGAIAKAGGLKTYGTAVIREDGEEQQVPAGLFEMSVEGGGTLQTYCVDLRRPTQRDARYHETPWSGTSLGSNRDAGKIRWILQNSYPQVNDLATLARRAGAPGLTEQDAAAGTQVAIWRYSDGADVTAADPQAEKLADYLERSARNVPEPQASLFLDPPAVSGRAGELVGPVTVRTIADSLAVIPPAAADGVAVVDENGEPVTSATDGTRLYFQVPEDAEDGTAELTVEASTTVPVGRAFASEDRSQTQILAGSSESSVSASATATWAATGPIPALSAQRDCTEGGIGITAANAGDQPFTFALMGTEYTVGAGQTTTVTVPLQEDQSYDFTLAGPDGFQKRVKGVLDCVTVTEAEANEPGDRVQTLSEPSPATLADTTVPAKDLAETGSSGATPVIGGIAIGLLLIGAAALLIVRKREASSQD